MAGTYSKDRMLSILEKSTSIAITLLVWPWKKEEEVAQLVNQCLHIYLAIRLFDHAESVAHH